MGRGREGSLNILASKSKELVCGKVREHDLSLLEEAGGTCDHSACHGIGRRCFSVPKTGLDCWSWSIRMVLYPVIVLF